jgi:hypothetical protein
MGYENTAYLLEARHSRLGDPHTDATRDTLAKGVVTAAALGARDRHKLNEAALAFLSDPNKLGTSPRGNGGGSA